MATAVATYRFQFNPDFRFEDAERLVPYLSRLGITHVYSSPILRPRSGSSHGYDVVDPQTVNPDLGGETAFRSLVEALHAHGLRLILDVVPNHMAATSENRYWLDVLTYGASSDYAGWFDINWRSSDPDLWGRVVLPVLGAPLGEVLQKDQIHVSWERGRFVLSYFENRFPLDPATVPEVWESRLEALEHRESGVETPSLDEVRKILGRLRELPSVAARGRRHVRISREETEARLARLAQIVEASPSFRKWAQRTAAEFVEEDLQRVEALLERQAYRLSYWREGSRHLNYRRFFNINDLIAVRQEDPEVFHQTHRRVGNWIREGLVDGLRIDHIDGLRYPGEYLDRLQELREDEALDVWVEKILAPGENLPRKWPVAGTVGYEFLNQVERLQTSTEGFATIEKEYRRRLGMRRTFQDLANQGKRHVLKRDLSALVRRLTERLASIARSRGAGEDLELSELRRGVIEFVVALPVYRTYLLDGGEEVSSRDKTLIERALNVAEEKGRARSSVLELLREVLLGSESLPAAPELEAEWEHFVLRLQQLSGPAAAKGIEDTALYNYLPLASLNEVGGEPVFHGKDPLEDFHRANCARVENHPRTLLAATTHDTKRSADFRARVSGLSQFPKLWNGIVRRWRRKHRSLKIRIQGKPAPTRNAEYLIYQTLVGLYPSSGEGWEPPEEMVERLCGYLVKAVREGKRRTNWIRPAEDYERAVLDFARQLLTGEAHSGFRQELRALVDRVAPHGYWNSLTRTTLQFTSPGSPDLYQGDELWNFSLVDPDNRRPVDYELRRRSLDEILTALEGSEEERMEYLRDLVKHPESGKIKLHMINRMLQLRRRLPLLFAEGSYLPLTVSGEKERYAVSFLRESSDASILVVVPRLTAELGGESSSAPVGDEVWGGTRLELPERCRSVEWYSSFDRRRFAGGMPLRLADLLSVLPCAVLSSES